MDENGVWNVVVDETTGDIAVTFLGDAPSEQRSDDNMDSNGVLNKVFDPTTNTLRVVVV